MDTPLVPREVTAEIVASIRAGTYRVGDLLPTLDELNDSYFGHSAGPRPGREAYAPLIAAGMVEARQGRTGGHFLIAAEPAGASATLSTIASELRALSEKVTGIQQIALYVVEFQHLPTRESFGESLHSTRIAAEGFAVDMLVRLGESKRNAVNAAQLAGWTSEQTRAKGYGVRIYGNALGGGLITHHR